MGASLAEEVPDIIDLPLFFGFAVLTERLLAR
jgi:hypothetical protein